jgi:hypothetical protein
MVFFLLNVRGPPYLGLHTSRILTIPDLWLSGRPDPQFTNQYIETSIRRQLLDESEVYVKLHSPFL